MFSIKYKTKENINEGIILSETCKRKPKILQKNGQSEIKEENKHIQNTNFRINFSQKQLFSLNQSCGSGF